MKQSVYDHLSLTSFSPFLVSFYHLSPVILKCVYRVHCGHCYCVISIIIYIVNTIHHYIIIIYSCLKFLCLSPTMKHSIISSIYTYFLYLMFIIYLCLCYHHRHHHLHSHQQKGLSEFCFFYFYHPSHLFDCLFDDV